MRRREKTRSNSTNEATIGIQQAMRDLANSFKRMADSADKDWAQRLDDENVVGAFSDRRVVSPNGTLTRKCRVGYPLGRGEGSCLAVMPGFSVHWP